MKEILFYVEKRPADLSTEEESTDSFGTKFNIEEYMKVPFLAFIYYSFQ
jgi:hypothetical protein